jgi:hypothetical protein
MKVRKNTRKRKEHKECYDNTEGKGLRVFK